MVKKIISLCLAAGIIATGLWGCSAPATPESDMSGETQARREEDIPRGRYVESSIGITLEDGEQPNKGIQLMWCILLILLPIALLFAESSMSNLQSVSIVAAFPIGAVIVMIALSFLKDAKKYLQEMKNE